MNLLLPIYYFPRLHPLCLQNWTEHFRKSLSFYLFSFFFQISSPVGGRRLKGGAISGSPLKRVKRPKRGSSSLSKPIRGNNVGANAPLPPHMLTFQKLAINVFIDLQNQWRGTVTIKKVFALGPFQAGAAAAKPARTRG